LVGLFKTKQKYEELTKASVAKVIEEVEKDSVSKKDKKLTPEKLDSIKKDISDKMDKSIIPIPKKAKEKILEEIEKEAKDTTLINEINKQTEDDDVNIQFGGSTRLDKFASYERKNPDTDIDAALDSLGYEKNFKNRFLYTRAKTINSLSKDENAREQYFNQLLSYGSVAIFILLPFFTLFLKFFYMRRKFTYIDHLVFVFHVQTVFFMLLGIYFIILMSGFQPQIWIFIGLFGLYLFLAMRKFYMQGYFKTFFKFLLLNFSFGFVASVGIGLLFFISFMIF